ncbi:ferritin-like domain-containing protein, partial [Janthinobacterium sp.]|uniref:ferritin-like domain-containing protein n=1 Tax=Janthinobacterium sp. TaxID=1871054 RepID=UPI00293D6FA8
VMAEDAQKHKTAVAEHAQARWGLAARGATVEAGSPAMHFRLDRKSEVWAGRAADLYAQAAAAQWDPATAIDWDAAFELPDIVEDAVVQVLTYMIENEVAALVVPARFLGQLHPHFREVQAVLAIQIADEARHIEVFTRRLRMKGREPALSTAGGQNSLKTLLDESDFSIASFLLSVLGEGTFVSLLHFLHTHAPDPVMRQIARLAARDEARHVAFGMTHLAARLEQEPAFRTRLANAVQLRNDALSATSGLNEEVFDALIILAAGEFTPTAIAAGYVRVQELMLDMAQGRQARLEKLGFQKDAAERLAALHTRNFM